MTSCGMVSLRHATVHDGAKTEENKRIGGYVAKESGAVPEVVAPLADAVRFVDGK